MQLIISAERLKAEYLNGMPLPDEKGRPMSDAVMEAKVKLAVATFQRRYNIQLTPALIRLGDEPLPGEPTPTDELPLKRRDAPPYLPRTWENNRHASIKLPLGPVQKVHVVGLKLPGQSTPTIFDTSWVQVNRRNRVVQLYPGNNLSMVPTAMTGFGLSALHAGNLIPNAWQISYTAGYTQEQLEDEHIDVLMALGKLATIELLIPGSLDKFAAAGVTGLNIGVDGLSQGTQLSQNAGSIKYAALLQAYRDSLAEWEAMFKERSKGIQVGFA